MLTHLQTQTHLSGNLFNLSNIRLLRLTHKGTYQTCQTSEYFNMSINTLIRELVKPFKYQGTCTCLQRLTCQGTDLTFQTCSYSKTPAHLSFVKLFKHQGTVAHLQTQTHLSTFHTSGYFDTSTNTDSLVREHVKPFIHQGILTHLQTQTHLSGNMSNLSYIRVF